MRVLWRWGPAAGVIALLGALIAAAASTSVQATKLPDLNPPSPAPSVTSTLRPTGLPTDFPDSELAGELDRFPSWMVTAVLLLAAAAVISVVIAVLWTVLRGTVRVKVRTLPQPAPANKSVNGGASEARAAVQAGIDALDYDNDPRRAVIACWVGLEAAAADAGTARESGDTPAELVRRLLATQQVSVGVLAELAELYRMARYAPHVIDEDMRTRARSALTHLHAELTRTAETVR
ncbi:MAG: DUF4129 domain-containing protein [Longispora sp.]|nr:DUF4129 domain-containing protein [Longispora sp. (in: high G+C Gram-positive bacteria)]